MSDPTPHPDGETRPATVDLEWYTSSATFDHDLDVACAIEWFDERSAPINAAAVRLLVQQRDDYARQAAEGWTVATSLAEQLEGAKAERSADLAALQEAYNRAQAKIAEMETPRSHRFDQCTETCTVDCGHCKGRPVAELRAAYGLILGANHALRTERDRLDAAYNRTKAELAEARAGSLSWQASWDRVLKERDEARADAEYRRTLEADLRAKIDSLLQLRTGETAVVEAAKALVWHWEHVVIKAHLEPNDLALVDAVKALPAAVDALTQDGTDG